MRGVLPLCSEVNYRQNDLCGFLFWLQDIIDVQILLLIGSDWFVCLCPENIVVPSPAVSAMAVDCFAFLRYPLSPKPASLPAGTAACPRPRQLLLPADGPPCAGCPCGQRKSLWAPCQTPACSSARGAASASCRRCVYVTMSRSISGLPDRSQILPASRPSDYKAAVISSIHLH